MNHDHDRSRSLVSRSRPILIHELAFGVRAGSGGPRLRPRDFQLAGSRARSGAPRLCCSSCDHGKLASLVRTPNPRKVTRPYLNFPLPTAASSSRFAPPESHSTMNRAFGKKTKGCFSSKARFSAVVDAFCSSIANPNCPSCTRGLSSAACRVLLRRTRLRRFIKFGNFSAKTGVLRSKTLQNPGFCAAKPRVLRSKTPCFAQPARRLSAI